MEDDMTQDEDTEGPIGDGLANEESDNIPPREKRITSRPIWWDDFYTD
jgi:hypothetical protein